MKTIFTSKRTIAIIVFLFFAFLFLLAPTRILFPVAIKFVSSCIVISGLLKLTLLNKRALGHQEFYFDLFEGFVLICIGVVTFRFYNYSIVTLSAGCIYVIIPIIRIIFSNNKLNQLLIDCLKYFNAIILISSYNVTLLTKYILTGLFFVIALAIIVTLVKKIVRKYKLDKLEGSL